MAIAPLLRSRTALLVLVLMCGLAGFSGCAGGWGDLRPTITSQSTKQTVNAGQTATFSVTATGTGPLEYQWFKNGVAIPGATSPTYSSTVTGSDNGAVYTVSVTNEGGTVMSAPFGLTVNTAPVITTQPTSQTVVAGQPATFTVAAGGTDPLTYQWFDNGTAISGATSSSYTIPGTTVASTGSQLTVVVTNEAGTVTSSVATLTVNPEPATLSFAPIPGKTYGSAAFPVSATSASAGPVTYTVVSGPATVSGSNVTLTGTGTVVLSASQPASGNYAATSASTSFTVAPASPTLSFAAIAGQIFGNSAFPVTATSASTGAVTYTVVSGPATVSGSTVTITGTGTVVLGATQAATSNYTAATATASFEVATAVPTLSFGPIPAQTFGNPAFPVSATSASSGAVTYTVVSGPATISGSTVTLTGAGTVVLSANQAASGNYAGATASASFSVAPATPTLSFTTVPSKIFGAAAFPVIASSASSGAITYSVVSGPATISGSSVTVTGVGTVVLGASQAATSNYTAATANTSFSVTPAVPTLSFASIGSQTFGNAAFPVSATSASSGAVTYTVVSGPATISGSTVTLTGAGTVVLSASQAASGNYLAATASTNFNVAPAAPNLAFAAIGSKTFGDAAFSVSATSASSGAVTYTVVSGPATISGSTVTLTGAGTVVLAANQAATDNYTAANASTSFSIAANVSISPISPTNQVLAPGQITFNATATGGETNTLLWTASGGTFTGNVWTSPTTAGTYIIRATSVDQPSVYVMATVSISAPVITGQPASQNVCTNASTTLSVAANYASTYQWNLGGVAIAGATASSYFIPTALSMDAGNYTATVANPAGSVTSNVARVVVGSSVSSNPASLSIYATQTATFSVSAAGISPFTYNWYRVAGGNAVLIPSATSSSYTTPAATTGDSGEQFYATVTDACGTVLTSSRATLTVTSANVPPTVTAQPLGQTVAVGGTTTFTAAASGTPSLSYQWYRIPAGSVAGTAISGATSASYTVPATATNAGNDQDAYFVVVKNPYGQAVSQNATLAVGNGVLIQISDQPSTVYVNAGAPAAFSVTASSALPLTYQWYRAAPGSSTFSAISGATGATYTLPSPSVADTGAVYHVVVSNTVTSSVTSSSASLFVGALASIPSCSSSWSTLGDAAATNSCSFQLTAASTVQYGEIVWPTLISTGNIQLSYTIATSNPSSTPADGFAMVLGDPSLGATPTSQGAVGEGLGARGIPGFVLAFDDYENNASGGWPQDPGIPYLGVGRGEDALWENPYFNVNTNIPALAAYGQTISHDYVVTIVQGQMTVTMDGTQVFSGHVSVPPVAYLYVTSSTGASWEQTVISNISATVSAPSN